MTREEIINGLKLTVEMFTESRNKTTIDACRGAIAVLEQESCEDAISRQAALDLMADYDLSMGQVVKGIHALPPVMSQQKIGKWILSQRDKCIDISCSECGNTRFKDYTYGGTIDELDLEEINDLLAKIRMNYCECCGAKMQGM